MLKYLAIGVSLAFILIWAGYWYQTYHVQKIKVDSCDEAFFKSVNRLHDLVVEKRFNRPFYEVVAYNNERPCIFFSYYEKEHILSFGTEPMSGWVRNAVVTERQLKSLAESLAPDTGLEKIDEYFSRYPKADSTRSIPTSIAY